MARVLIVDDEDDTVLTLRLLLEHVGHSVAVARDGGEAMLKIGSFKPDVVVLDLMLPNVNGWEMLDSKDQSDARDVPVIVLSGWKDLPQPLTGTQIRCIMGKPVDPNTLIEEVRRATLPS